MPAIVVSAGPPATDRHRRAQSEIGHVDRHVKTALRGLRILVALVDAEKKPARDGCLVIFRGADQKRLPARIGCAEPSDQRAVAAIGHRILVDQVLPAAREPVGIERLRRLRRIRCRIRDRPAARNVYLLAHAQVDVRIDPLLRAIDVELVGFAGDSVGLGVSCSCCGRYLRSSLRLRCCLRERHRPDRRTWTGRADGADRRHRQNSRLLQGEFHRSTRAPSPSRTDLRVQHNPARRARSSDAPASPTRKRHECSPERRGCSRDCVD